jgi:hypothetical protein
MREIDFCGSGFPAAIVEAESLSHKCNSSTIENGG